MSSASLIPFLIAAALVFVAGLFATRRFGNLSLVDYFLAGRDAGAWTIGLSLFVTTLSAEWVLGAAGMSFWVALVAAGGIALGVWILGPKVLASGPFTLPQFVSWRFDQKTGLMLSGGSIAFTLAVRMPLVLVTGMAMLHRLTGFDPMLGGFILVLAAGTLVLVGGCTGLFAGHTLQGAAAFAGAAFIALWSLASGGLNLQSIPSAELPSSDIPWPIGVIGALVIAVWYWTGDHFVAQRFLAARDAKAIGKGTAIAAVMTVAAAPFVFPLPLQQAELAAPNPVVTMVLAVIVSAVVMAALAGYIHSTAALLTLDFYVGRHPAATDRKLVSVGRNATLIIVLATLTFVSGILTVPASSTAEVQLIQFYLAGPVAALMLAVLFSQRMLARGAVMGLIAGGLIELVHAVANVTGVRGPLAGFADLPAVEIALIAFVVTLAVIILGGSPAAVRTPAHARVRSHGAAPGH
jgi:SSS family solute:Na+ symporter